MQSDMEGLSFIIEKLENIQKLNAEGVDTFDPKMKKALDEADSSLQNHDFKDAGLGFVVNEIDRETGITSASLKKVTEELKAMREVANQLDGLQGQSVEQIKEAMSTDSTLDTVVGSVQENESFNRYLKEIEKIGAGEFRGSILDKGLREGGENDLASTIGRNVRESETFRMALVGQMVEEAKNATDGFSDLSAAISAAKDIMEKQASARDKARAAFDKMIAAQDLATNSLERFSNNMAVATGNIENLAGYLSEGTSFLQSTGSISEKEANRRQFQIEAKAIEQRSTVAESQDLMSFLKDNIDIGDMFNVDDIVKTEMNVQDKEPTSIVGKMQKDVADEKAPQNEALALEFAKFSQQNADGNYSLSEIRHFIDRVGALNEEGNKIAKKAQIKMDKHEQQAKLQRDKLILSQELQRAQMAEQFLNDVGGNVASPEDVKAVGDLSKDLSLVEIAKNVERNKFSPIDLGPSGQLSDNDRKGLNEVADADRMAGIMGVSPTMLTGKTSSELSYYRGMGNAAMYEEAIRENNEGMLPPGFADFFERLRDRLTESFEITEDAQDNINKASEEYLGNDLSKIEDPIVRLNVQMAQLLSDGINIKNINALNNPIPGSEPPAPAGGVSGVVGDGISDESVGGNVNQILESLGSKFEELGVNISSLSTTLTESKVVFEEMPGLIKAQLEEITMQHTISGSIEMNFNSDVVRGVLGPAMYDELKRILLEPMVLDYLSTAIGARIDPQGRLK